MGDLCKAKPEACGGASVFPASFLLQGSFLPSWRGGQVKTSRGEKFLSAKR